MTSPSETLVAAADLIRDLAAKATPGAWKQVDRVTDVGAYVLALKATPGAPLSGGDVIAMIDVLSDLARGLGVEDKEN